MGLQLNGVDVERIYVDGIECDSVWVNGIQVVVPVVEIGNQSSNGGARFNYRNSNNTAIGVGSGSIAYGFDDVIGVAFGYVRCTSSTPYYTQPQLSIGSVKSSIAGLSKFTRGSATAWVVSAAQLYVSGTNAYLESGVSQDLIDFCALYVSAVGVNNADHYDALCSDGFYKNKKSMTVSAGDLVLFYSSANSFSWGTAAGMSHGLLVDQHPATNGHSPRLFEVTSPGVISNVSGSHLLILVGRR